MGNNALTLPPQDMKALEKKRAEGEQLQGNFDSMRAKDQADGEALAAAERRLQAISSGMYSAGDGEDATLEEQLMSMFTGVQPPLSDFFGIFSFVF